MGDTAVEVELVCGSVVDDEHRLTARILDDSEIEAMLEQYRSPLRTAEAFGIEEVIDPRDTRPLLCDWVKLAYDRTASELGPKARTTRP